MTHQTTGIRRMFKRDLVNWTPSEGLTVGIIDRVMELEGGPEGIGEFLHSGLERAKESGSPRLIREMIAALEPWIKRYDEQKGAGIDLAGLDEGELDNAIVGAFMAKIEDDPEFCKSLMFEASRHIPRSSLEEVIETLEFVRDNNPKAIPSFIKQETNE